MSITTICSRSARTIVLLAGLQGISEEIYEACAAPERARRRMFTAASRSRWWSPSLFFLLVVDTVAVIQAFTQIHLLTRGGPVDATRTLRLQHLSRRLPDFSRIRERRSSCSSS